MVNMNLWPYNTTDLSLLKIYGRYDWCASAPTEGDRVKLVRAVFNRIMEDNAFRAADGEDPLSYDEMERIMKDIMIGKHQLPLYML